MKKKLTILFLQISLVWMGISVLTDSVNATKQDAARALELLRQARAAIGGEEAVNNVQNISYKGKSKRVIKIKNQPDREIMGDVEMAVLFPDQIFRMEKIGVDEGVESETIAFQDKDGKFEEAMIIELRDEDVDGEKHEWKHNNNEMLRFTLGFLLSAPKGGNVSYDYTGEESLDGRTVNVIAVSSNGNSLMRLYLDKQSNLPVMMSYKGFSHHAPMVFERQLFDKENGRMITQGDKDVIIFRERVGEGSGKKLHDKMNLEKSEKIKAPANGEGQKFTVRIPEPTETEIQLKFGDYRSVNGIKLPHQLTEVVNGTVEQTITIDGYEINVPNMAERFKQSHVRVKVRKPE